MQILAFDYIRDRPSGTGSLAKLATLIANARAQAKRQGKLCMLFDNGDTLQGNAMADWLAQSANPPANPMVACINQLEYDACGLGNHDCDFGLDYLQHCLAGYRMPVVSSNLTCDSLRTVRPDVMFERKITDNEGEEVTLKIGVLSSLPDKTAAWNRHHLNGRARLVPPVPVLREKAAQQRREGADLVVVLAHMGLHLFDEGPEAQNQVAEVAALTDVDAVIGGHTHLRFPGPDHAGVDGIDTVRGLVDGKPVVQPGSSGSDLAQIDLTLARAKGDTKRWQVEQAHVTLLDATAKLAEDTAIVDLARPAHERTRRHLCQPAGRLNAPIHSFFALACPSPVVALMAAAKRQAIEKAVAGTELAELPLLSVASATLSGGFDGPENFISLDSGENMQRHIVGLCPYSNQVWAVRTTGRRLMEWVERSAVIFSTLQHDNPNQPLIDAKIPGFRYDAVYGLDYMIDPSKPPKYDAAGREIADREPRVSGMSWKGAPLDPDKEFLVATTDHRAGGGGLYRAFEHEEVVVQGQNPVRKALQEYLETGAHHEMPSKGPWSFAPDLGQSAILHTAPEAVNHLSEIAALRPEVKGIDEDGFLQLKLHL